MLTQLIQLIFRTHYLVQTGTDVEFLYYRKQWSGTRGCKCSLSILPITWQDNVIMFCTMVKHLKRNVITFVYVFDLKDKRHIPKKIQQLQWYWIEHHLCNNTGRYNTIWNALSSIIYSIISNGNGFAKVSDYKVHQLYWGKVNNKCRTSHSFKGF